MFNSLVLEEVAREAPAGAEGRLERTPTARRTIGAFPRGCESASPVPLGAALALAPKGTALTLRLGRSGASEPLAGRVELYAADPAKAEQWLDQLAGVAFPACRLEGSAELPRRLAYRHQIVPEAIDLESKTLAASNIAPLVSVQATSLSEETPLVSDVSKRDFDIATALGVAAAAGAFELAVIASSFVVDRRTIGALARLKERLSARAHRMGRMDKKGERLLELIEALASDGAGVRFEAMVSFESKPDPFTLNLLSLCLFGRRCSSESKVEAVDLRGVWPLQTTTQDLIPSADVAASLGGSKAKSVEAGQPGSLVLGRASGGRCVTLSPQDRDRHIVVIGATGTGKSSLLLNLMRQDFESGEGVILLDPHGDLASDALKLVPAQRRGDVIFADASDVAGAFRINILSGQGGEPAVERNYVANGLIRLFTRVLYSGVPEAFGPMFESYFRNALLLLMEAGGEAPNLLDFESIFLDDDARAQMLERCTDEKVLEFWTKLAPAVTQDETSLNNIAPYIACKLTQFTGNPVLRRLLCQPGPGLDMRAAMNEGQIVFLKMPKGLLGQSDTELLAALVTMRIAQIGMARAALPLDRRRQVRFYVDEFQTCAGEGLADLLAEARKFGISLVLANQSLSQVDGRGHRPDTGAAAVANAANLIAFRVGAPDAARLAPWFAPDIPWVDLCRTPDFHAVVRALDHGRPAPATLVKMAPPP